MGIQILSISHKAAPTKVRERFAFTLEQQHEIMKQLLDKDGIEECVMLATCNRTELYVYGAEDGCANRNFEQMKQILLKEAGTFDLPDIGDYLLIYQDNTAIHHLFVVASGLDSMVIGEDQILGQVKRAHDFARENKLCGTYLNALFRYAVTGAKKVKTDTSLSKTPISTASLAIKAAEDALGGLKDKNILIIGATGKIGSIVLKDLQDKEGARIYITARGASLPHGIRHLRFEVVPYESRYHVIQNMDVIISATSSPHFTITRDHFMRYWKEGEQKVLLDLAVPMDLDPELSGVEGIQLYNMDDFTRLAEDNNRRKQKEVIVADSILSEYERTFKQWMLFQRGLGSMQSMKAGLLKEADEKGVEKALDHFFYEIRKQSEPEELAVFLKLIDRYGKEKA